MQAGWTEETSHQNYAVETSTVDMEPGFTAHYIAYSMEWHKFWGLETEQRARGSTKYSRAKVQPGGNQYVCISSGVSSAS